jgi:tRNA threonylcarbamoyladenosine biosynthesis protein TsaB
MIVLGVDTTTSAASVALVRDGALAAELRLAGGANPSTALVPAVGFALGQLGLAPGQIDGFAVTVGPGSFTGIRVGLSTVQGMALGTGRPCVGIAALDVLAARIEAAADVLVAMMIASRGDVFAGVYDARARLIGQRTVGSLEQMLARLPGAAAFIGEAAEVHRDRILALVPDARFPSRSRFLAGTLARMAEPPLAAGKGVDPSALRPLYLREAEIGKRGA